MAKIEKSPGTKCVCYLIFHLNTDFQVNQSEIPGRHNNDNDVIEENSIA